MRIFSQDIQMKGEFIVRMPKYKVSHYYMWHRGVD